MFARKKNYGRAGYVDDPLPNNLYLCFCIAHALSFSFVFFTKKDREREGTIELHFVYPCC